MPLNDSNFLMWFNLTDNVFAYNLPRPFVFEPEVMSPVVWMVPGETYSYYINSLSNLAFTESLGLVHENGSTTNLQAGSSIAFPSGEHSYGSFVTPNLPEGYCYLKIGNRRTQWIWLTTAAKASRFTALVKFRNGQRLMNYRYSYLADDFYQVFRVRMAMKGEEPETNKTTYRESTTGKTRHLYSEPRQIVTMQTPEYDRWGHRAITALLEHDEIYINDVRYAFAAAYKSNMNEGDALSTGEFAVSDENYATLHRS